MSQFASKKRLVVGLMLTCLISASLAVGLSLGIGNVQPAVAISILQGFSPKQYKDGKQYGNGVYFAPHDVAIYDTPTETGKIIERFHWDKQNAEQFSLVSDVSNQSMPIRNVFLAFYPQANVAMMAVIGESAGYGPDGKEILDPNEATSWVEVIYDQEHKKSGWVYLEDERKAPAEAPHLGIYQSWLDFMKLNAKPVGVYFLGGVTQYQRSLRQKDADDSPLIDTIVIRDMKVKHVRGNWLLVEVLDFAHNTPIGWIRWRDDEGNLMAFPNLTQEKGKMIITGY